jgi:hypothetical protein
VLFRILMAVFAESLSHISGSVERPASQSRFSTRHIAKVPSDKLTPLWCTGSNRWRIAFVADPYVASPYRMIGSMVWSSDIFYAKKNIQ